MTHAHPGSVVIVWVLIAAFMGYGIPNKAPSPASSENPPAEQAPEKAIEKAPGH